MLRRVMAVLTAVFLSVGTTKAQKVINGAGATFPYPLISKWSSEYQKINPNVRINYQAIGSGGGIRQLVAGTVNFGASDAPMTEEQMADAKKAHGDNLPRQGNICVKSGLRNCEGKRPGQLFECGLA